MTQNLDINAPIAVRIVTAELTPAQYAQMVAAVTPAPVRQAPRQTRNARVIDVPHTVASAPDWDRLVPRIAAGTFTSLAVAEAAIVATNWRLFLHIIEGIGVILALLAALLVIRAVVALFAGESVTVTGRGLKVWRS